jgi:polyketide synthase 12/myxalamid-type polyketide synthase MxaF
MESLADIRRWLIEFFSASLGINPQELDPAERFKSYGVDSAAALRITAGVAQHLGRPLEQTLLWDCPTVDQLAAYLAHPQPATAPAAGAVAGPAADEPIAIIGMACRLPGAADKGAYWRMLTGGEAAITEVPDDRWNAAQLFDADFRQPGKMNTRWGGFIGGVDEFEPGFFGISPREAVQMDPQQRIMLELSLHALHDAGIPVETLKGTATGVFFGAVWNDYLLLGKQAGIGSITQHTATGTHHSLIANRVSYTFGFQGPSLAIDTACSSSLVSVHLAVNSLRSGEATLALAGGVNLILSPDSTIAMSKFGAMAPDGRCKAFDASADGYVRGEGAGIVVLKPLAAALADGDRVYCVVAGSAVNNDGMSNGLSAPNPKAQEEVLAAAYRKAGIDPGAVRYLETHGTGTALGDPIEAKSIGKVLCRERSEDRPLFLGAVKTNIGHLEAAAGIAGLIKAALVVSHRLIPANLNFRQPNPNVPFGPYKLAVPLRNEAWPEPAAAIAGVSSFGFGGTNCHVVLREVPVHKPCLAALAAGDPESLRAALAGWLRDGVPAPAAPPAGGRVRFAAAADSRPALEGVVRRFVDGQPSPGAAALTGEGEPPPLVFVFSGQGSQWAGMGRELLAREPVFRAALECIDAVFRPLSGWSVADELARAGDGRGKQIEVVQPLLFSVQVGLSALWEDWGVRPDVVVGHSMGEAAAAYVAGMLSLADAVRVIYHRSRLMARLTGQGGMLAVGLESGALAPWLVPYPQLNVAVRNSPSSTVVSGAREALVRLAADLEGQHVFNRLIQVEVASHSPQVASLEAELYAALASIAPRPGRCRMVSTVYGREVACHALNAGYWVRNLAQPVEFLPATLHLLGQADPVFVEVSPHPILQKAIEETAASLGRQALVLPSLAKDETPYGTLAGTVARLYAKGYAPRWPQVGQSVTVATGGMPAEAEAEAAGENRVLVLSAHTPGSLSDLVRDVHRQVQAPGAAYRDLVYTAAVRRTHLPHRVAVVAGSADQLARALAEHLAGESAPAVFRGARPLHYARKITFVFSGQGAQWQGMAAGLLAREPVFAEAVAACDALLEELGVHQWTLRDKITNPGPGDLQQTEVAQPLIFSIQMGLAALWESWGIRPGAVVGHSVGEVAAACVAGILSLRDALALVCYRGLACRELQGKGAMAAVDLPEARVRELLQALPAQLLEVAAVNSPASTVVAGEPAALRAFLAARAREGSKCNVISDQYAFHSRQTEAIQPALLRKVRKLAAQPSDIPFYSTVTGALQQGHGCDAAYWLDNLRCEVRFSAAVQALLGDGYATFLELGPHPSLSLPLTQVLSHAGTPGTVLGSLARQKDDHQVMYRSLALLYAQGADIDWKAVYPQGGRPADLPTYPFRRESYWLERTAAAPGPAGEPAYPFPGKKITYPGQGGTRSFQLSLPAVPGEDREAGTASGASILLEMVLSALRQVWAGEEGVVLRKVVFYGVPGAGTGESLLQVDLVPAGEGFRFRLHGLRPAEDQWVEYATGLAARPAPGTGDDAAGADAGAALPVGLDAAPAGEKPRGCLPPRLLQRVLGAALPAVGRPATLLSCGEVEYLRPLGAACRYRVEDLTQHGTGCRMTLVLFTPQHERAAVLRDLYCAFSPGAGDEAPLAGLLYQPAWREALLEDGKETGEASPWLVFEDEGGLGGKIAGFLAARGLPCVRVAAGTGYEVLSGTRYRIDPARPAHYRRLLADLGCRAARVLHLWSLSVPCDPQAPAGELDRALLLGTGSVLHLLQALKQADGERPDHLVVVTRGAQAVDDGPLHAALAPVWGIGRVLRAENPDWHSQLIDCSPTDDCFDCLAAELMAPGQGGEIAYRGGRRYVSHLAPLPALAPDPVRPDPAKSYLVTGGFGALGLATAHWLVDHGAVHLALLGRSGGEHASRELARLRGRGARVQVLALDIADGPALAQALRTLHHPLGGIVHAAGVADNARLEEMDWDRFRKTLLPKVQGTWNLLQLTRQHPVDFFIAYSSVASLLGFKKLGSYAAANAFLDAAMQQRHREGLPGLAVNWGPVEAGMTFDARYFRVRDLARIGLRPMPTEVVGNVLRTLWGGGTPQVLAADADWTVLRHGLAEGAPMLSHLSPAATQGPGRQPAGLSKPELAAYLQRLVKKVLEIKSLDYEKSLPQLGMDSLMAVEFLTDFRRQFNLSLSPAVFYHSSSFDDLTDRVYEQLAGETVPDLPDPQPTYN